MIDKTKINKRTIVLLLIATMFVSGIYMNSLVNESNLNNDVESENTDREYTDKPLNEKNLETSVLGDAVWWNNSFQYRKLINISNPCDVDFTNFIASFEFNYSKLVEEGKMNESLKDLRIVENGVLRDYYIVQNYTVDGNATIWFKTNASRAIGGIPTIENDTYMYYGNDTVSYASDYLMSRDPRGYAWWKMDENGGLSIYDTINGIEGELHGGPSWTSGGLEENDYALDFDGSNEYVSLRMHYEAGVNNSLHAFTASAWIKLPDNRGGGWSILDFDRSEYFTFAAGPDGYTASGDPYVEFDTTSSEGTHDMLGTIPIDDGKWHFVTVVYNSSETYDKKIYVDGVLDNEVDAYSTGIAIGSGTSRNRYGYIGDGSESSTYDGSRNNQYYDGIMDDVRFYNNSALNQEKIEWQYNNYTLGTELNEEQEISATVKVIVKDMDGRVVPNAEILAINSSNKDDIIIGNTNGLGYYNFVLDFGETYNFTVNYTIWNNTIPIEKTFYNGTELSESYTFNGLSQVVYIKLKNMWTIDFEIEDWENEAMDYGFIEIYNQTYDNVNLLTNLTINDNTGTQSFRWINQSSYIYRVYYKNADYFITNTLVNQSTILRDEYVNNIRNTTSLDYYFEVNQSSSEPKEDPRYRVNEYIYITNSSSTHLGNYKIINVSVNMENMEDDIDNLDLYYINSNNDPILFADESTSGVQTSFSKDYNVTEYGDAFGIRLDVEGSNSTTCNGRITVNITQSHNNYIKLNMSSFPIYVYTIGEFDPEPLENVIVQVRNASDPSTIVASLRTNENGYAKGQINDELDFWYIRDEYNITLRYYNTPFEFNVTDSDQTFYSNARVDYYEYNLTQSSGGIELFMDLDRSKYLSEIQGESWDQDVYYGSSLTFNIKFGVSSNGGSSYQYIDDPDYLSYEIRKQFDNDILMSGDIELTADANDVFDHTLTLSNYSGELFGGNTYIFEVSGDKVGYLSPDEAELAFNLNNRPTSVSLHNFNNISKTFTNVSQYYNEIVKISVKYTDTLNGNPITGANLSYSWNFGSGDLTVDPSHSGYYYFEINTSQAKNVGLYKIYFTAEQQNYATVQDYVLDLNILRRPTQLNGQAELVHISRTLWIKQAYNFTFQYNDTRLNKSVSGLEEAHFQWYEIGSNGQPLGDPSSDVQINESKNELNETIYLLDFDTETRDVGDYALFVTLQKYNYEVRNAFIDLRIRKRVFNTSLTATNLQGSQINVVQGKDVELRLVLEDPTNNGAPLIDANISLQIGNDKYDFNETEDGVYTFTFSTDQINTLLASQTLSGNITISKEDYETQTLPITIAVGMTEIFPGMPTFYFMMIVGSAIAVAGSLAGYRYYQLAKIPEFVKRARSMSKDIKGGKTIDKTLLYPSKKEFMVESLSDRWEELGLSLANILGVETKESKMIKKKTPSEKIKTKEPSDEVKTKTPESKQESESEPEEGGAE